MFELSVIVKWIHISSASIVVGAAAMLAWCLAAAAPTEGSAVISAGLLVKPLRILVHSALGLLLITGAYNAYTVYGQANGDVWHTPLYQALLGTKFLLYLAVYALAI